MDCRIKYKGKFVLGLITKTVNFFQDVTYRLNNLTKKSPVGFSM